MPITVPPAPGDIFSEALKQARRRAGLVQAALGDSAGVSTRHISFLETGRARPSQAMVSRLADALGLDDTARDAFGLAAGFAPRPRNSASSRLGLALHDPRMRAAFDAAVAVQSAQDAEAAASAAASGLAELGLTRFATGTLSVGPAGIDVRFDAAGRPALGWLKHYRISGHRRHDPLVRLTANAWTAFLWSDVLKDPEVAPDSRRVLDEAREFGIGGGFVLPLRRPDGSVRALTSWAERTDGADPVLKPAARLVAASLLEAAERLESDDSRPELELLLTPERRAVLGWLAAGRDSDWIARRTGAREAEVLRTTAEACVDLGVADPWQAVTRAAALGLIAA